MSNDLMIFGIFGLILLVFFVLIILKDIDASRKFTRHEKVLEGLLQEIHAIKKQLANQSGAVAEQINIDEIQAKLQERLNEQITSKIIPIINTLQGIESSIDSFQAQQQDRLFTLEERTKNIGKISASSDDIDEKRIIQMYNEGKSAQSIAKELCIGVGRVELVLKLKELV